MNTGTTRAVLEWQNLQLRAPHRNDIVLDTLRALYKATYQEIQLLLLFQKSANLRLFGHPPRPSPPSCFADPPQDDTTSAQPRNESHLPSR